MTNGTAIAGAGTSSRDHGEFDVCVSRCRRKASCQQTVHLTYNFQGFFAPVDNAPVVNTVKNGAMVPVKWRLMDAGGAYVTSPATVLAGYPKYAAVPCEGGVEAAVEETVAAGGSSLRWDSDGAQFIYNWATPALPGQCLRLDLRLIDGETHSAQFKLK